MHEQKYFCSSGQSLWPTAIQNIHRPFTMLGLWRGVFQCICVSLWCILRMAKNEYYQNIKTFKMHWMKVMWYSLCILCPFYYGNTMALLNMLNGLRWSSRDLMDEVETAKLIGGRWCLAAISLMVYMETMENCDEYLPLLNINTMSWKSVQCILKFFLKLKNV